MTWIFPATSDATVLFLFLGTWLFRDTPAERAEVDAFMDRIGGKTTGGRA